MKFSIYIPIAIASIPVSITLFALIMIDNQISGIEGIKIIELILLAISAVSGITTLYIAIIAYKNWHKPNKYEALRKSREELYSNVKNATHFIEKEADEIRLIIANVIDLMERIISDNIILNDKEVINERLNNIADEMEKKIEKITQKREIVENIFNSSQLLFHKPKIDVEKEIEKYSQEISRDFKNLSKIYYNLKISHIYTNNISRCEIEQEILELNESLEYFKSRLNLHHNNLLNLKNILESEIHDFVS